MLKNKKNKGLKLKKKKQNTMWIQSVLPHKLQYIIDGS